MLADIKIVFYNKLFIKKVSLWFFAIFVFLQLSSSVCSIIQYWINLQMNKTGKLLNFTIQIEVVIKQSWYIRYERHTERIRRTINESREMLYFIWIMSRLQHFATAKRNLRDFARCNTYIYILTDLGRENVIKQIKILVFPGFI